MPQILFPTNEANIIPAAPNLKLTRNITLHTMFTIAEIVLPSVYPRLSPSPLLICKVIAEIIDPTKTRQKYSNKELLAK